MRHPRSLVVILLTITVLLFGMLGFLLFHSDGDSGQERGGAKMYKSTFAPSTPPDLETSSAVSQDNTETKTSFGSDADMEFPVLD